jgi:hypothetical protein
MSASKIKVTNALVDLLKADTTTLYGCDKLVQSITGDPLKFSEARINHINKTVVFIWAAEVVSNEIRLQNYDDNYILNVTIHSKHRYRSTSIQKIDDSWSQIKKLILTKEFNGLSLSEYYTDDNSSVIAMTPNTSVLSAPDEADDVTVEIILDSGIEILVNNWI